MKNSSLFQRYWNGRRESEKSTMAKVQEVIERMKADKAYKSMSDDAFKKEVEDMLRKLGISGGGPIPNSLLARQDLEPREKFMKDEKPGWDSENPHEQPKDKSMGLCVKWNDAMGCPQVREFLNQTDADAFATLIRTMQFGYTGITVEKTHDIAIQHVLNGVKQMVHAMDEKLDEYESAGGTEKSIGDNCPECMALRAQFGTRFCDYHWNHGGKALDDAARAHADMIWDKSKTKGMVEQTGKQLDAAAKKAEDAETTSEKKSVIENIKAIQLKRQRATIAFRSKGLAGKSFKGMWEENKNKL